MFHAPALWRPELDYCSGIQAQSVFIRERAKIIQEGKRPPVSSEQCSGSGGGVERLCDLAARIPGRASTAVRQASPSALVPTWKPRPISHRSSRAHKDTKVQTRPAEEPGSAGC
ncbi:unnamed protein product [Pleuronectes platessa]|uniref:Uncharacterized protein n=1 Tax=Pleuronectes platessa TaxID=8262 RepID=A0A9N7YI95_PLEPL|nr:unnamed protein product [Pleuronectes platessa]